ncbi:MAG: SagB/ThcOx family dehydrogenase [Candidatus Thorarchaeota archaeon]|nr:MAG: SagB/ThcOx family dehydrogenase [Candidatus Thorarchaeota archaeon]
MTGSGDDFLGSTKYVRGALPRHRLDWSTKPPTYKVYQSATRVSLPTPDVEGGLGLWDSLQKRRSTRAYTDEPLTQQQLSQLLWASQGISARRGEYDLRTAPSAGALYPVETYLCINRVEEINPGLYHYSVPNHELECLEQGSFAAQVRRGALDQQLAEHAPVVFIWSAVFARSKWKYLQRAYRYIFLDSGHIAQNLALAAEALGLGTCQVGAIYDDELNSLLGLDGIEESVIYLSSVGHTRRPNR